MREQTDILAPMGAQMTLMILTVIWPFWARANLVSARKAKMSDYTCYVKKGQMKHFTADPMLISFKLFLLGAFSFSVSIWLSDKAVF